ncbi:hypothetical protein NLX83_01740 [Allokutzneria sp. A3M-2-11 16]|uniref:E2/UBC family protein n=1 Tax=Allokutzneria sp. A3M-2-11 16 TaxID=2962043 RepID=UPI0020B83602|nr:E2/UBC family protein [Allokutzneria sp. A3M-2-11 16]MCP3797971.1 hypothetical protein [Allokutzneria sp. A3M-2-11 16]
MSDLETTLRISRLRAESYELSKRYPEVTFDTKDGMWLHVKSLEIAKGWNRKRIEVLIDIPCGTPGYPSVAPQWFWADHDLKTDTGQPISHFFSRGLNEADQQYTDKGWGHFCVHVNRWNPAGAGNLTKGHSLITYLDLIRAVFTDRKRLGN